MASRFLKLSLPLELRQDSKLLYRQCNNDSLIVELRQDSKLLGSVLEDIGDQFQAGAVEEC